MLLTHTGKVYPATKNCQSNNHTLYKSNNHSVKKEAKDEIHDSAMVKDGQTERHKQRLRDRQCMKFIFILSEKIHIHKALQNEEVL